MLLTDHKEQPLNRIQSKIISIISNSKLVFAGRNYILLDYNGCGNDADLIAKLILLENMIEKHFVVVRRTYVVGQRDLTLSQNIA